MLEFATVLLLLLSAGLAGAGDEGAMQVSPRALIESGRYGEASSLLAERLKSDPHDWEARQLVIALSKITGDKRTLKEQERFLVSLYKRGGATTAPALTAVGMAVESSDPQSAAMVYQRAADADPSYLEAYIHAGRLYAEKYNYSKAREVLGRALKISPDSPETLCAMAEIQIMSGDMPGAVKTVDGLLASKPDCLDAVFMKAFMELCGENADGARKHLEKVLAANPRNPDALSLLAGCMEAAGDAAGRDSAIAKVREVNTSSTDAYKLLSHFASSNYDFEGAAAWAGKALEADPSDSGACYQAGTALLRLGEEDRGYELLKKSFSLNPFNVFAYNLLQVLDRDYRKKDCVLMETANFAVKMPRGDADVIWPYLAPLLEDSYGRLTSKYGFKPEGPAQYKGKILVIFLHSQQDFTARTVGLPGVFPAAGVCFGKVILLPSPRFLRETMGDYSNWKDVLVHEFMHVISLQATKYRIPRWFTEGLSCMEEDSLPFAYKQNFARMVADDRPFDIEKFASAFFPSGGTYYAACKICSYVRDTYGFDKIKLMMDMYRERKTFVETIEAATGRRLDDVEKDVVSLAKKDAAEFNSAMEALAVHFPELKEKEKNGGGHGEPATEPDEDSGSGAGKKYMDPFWLEKINALMDAKKSADAAAILEKLRALGLDGHLLYKHLAEAYLDMGRPDDALKSLENSFSFNPYDAQTHLAAAKIFKGKGNVDLAVRECRAVLALDKDCKEAEELLKTINN